MPQAASVVPSAAAGQPITGARPSATAALITSDATANRSGLRVSSRAKYNGCRTFCSTKAGRPSA